MKAGWCIILGAAAVACFGAGCATASDIDSLFMGGDYASPIDFTAFTKPASARSPNQLMGGHLHVAGGIGAGGFDVVYDPDGLAADTTNDIYSLPDIDFWLVQSGDAAVPVTRGIVKSAHPYFDLVFSPGAVWQENAGVRIALPFALMEKNANCIHNGALTVRVDADGTATKALVQVASETCGYLKFNLWGNFDAAWESGAPDGAGQIRDAYRAEVASRLPVAPIESLAGVRPAVVAQSDIIAADNMTVFGVVHDSVHYVGGCQTRFGPYPFCDSMVLPSYSLAKSLAAGVGLMRLEQLYPGARNAQVSDLVPACTDDAWRGVTLEHLLDMATGNYHSAKPEADEDSDGFLPFFLATTAPEKTEFSCSYFPRKSAPGTVWAYHTSDTYLLGVAMNAFLQAKEGPDADYFNDLVAPIWRGLGLSPLTAEMRRTAGPKGQPFSGYGMLLSRGDIARIATTFAGQDESLGQLLSASLLDGAMQRVPADRGLEAGKATLRYNNGFWGWNARDVLGCAGDIWLPFFSGYGGISVVMLPGGNAYYYFSDGYDHAFAGPVRELSNISPVCTETL